MLTAPDIQNLLNGQKVLFKPKATPDAPLYYLTAKKQNGMLNVFCSNAVAREEPSSGNGFFHGGYVPAGRQENKSLTERSLDLFYKQYGYEPICSGQDEVVRDQDAEVDVEVALQQLIPEASFKRSYHDDNIQGNLNVIKRWLKEQQLENIIPVKGLSPTTS